MTHFKGKKLSAIDRYQQAELARQKEVDQKHDMEFMAMLIVTAILALWCSVLSIALIGK
jgi:hypothetical protein